MASLLKAAIAQNQLRTDQLLHQNRKPGCGCKVHSKDGNAPRHRNLHPQPPKHAKAFKTPAHSAPRIKTCQKSREIRKDARTAEQPKCVQPLHSVGEEVEVMLLGEGQVTSDEWIPGRVVKVSCQGKYTLQNPHTGDLLEPALSTGIEAYHLRTPERHDTRLADDDTRLTDDAHLPAKRTNQTKQRRAEPPEACVPPFYAPGEVVEVMVLSQNQQRSNHWRSAVVSTVSCDDPNPHLKRPTLALTLTLTQKVSCDGEYSLKDRHGEPVKAALPSGIQAYHLRPAGERAAEAKLLKGIENLESGLASARKELLAHQEAVQARVTAVEHARELAETRAKKKAADNLLIAEEEEARSEKRKAEKSAALKAELDQISGAMAKAKQEYETLAQRRWCAEVVCSNTANVHQAYLEMCQC
eukprot:TRINITY_DN2578_c0_g1_i5.p1 TRINITY_DN2578_c0_g1~~TRINITY_DN2578_c0_g1_i5.p1  ORF type:complete len:413 (+),score=102.95 TRINITY_DN2578_c0_g1_i5:287-1525(+)